MRELFAAAFGRDMPVAELEWRYLEDPQDDVLVAVEPDGERWAASYSASPCAMSWHGRQLTTALSLNTMTHPDHAGRGLFTALAGELYDAMAARGYAVIWGFPNIRSHRGFVTRLGWSDVYELPTMSVAVDVPGRPAREPRFDDGFELDYPHAALPLEELHAVKDRELLRRRYARHPRNRYRNLVLADSGAVRSHCVVKEYDGGLDIVDMRASDAGDVGALLDTALAFAARSRLDRASCWAPRHHPLHGECERRGFRHALPVTYLGGRVLGGDEPDLAAALPDFSSWYIQMGDSDVY